MTAQSKPGERMVTLHDGRVVSNYSEEWRHETEASTILGWPSKRQRQVYLWGIEEWHTNNGKRWKKVVQKGVIHHRGEAACRRLEETILSIWRARKAA